MELVKRDFNKVGMNLDEPQIQESSKAEFKIKVKHAFKQYVFKKLKKLQEGHSKISTISYQTFEAQRYLSNHTLNQGSRKILIVRTQNSSNQQMSDGARMLEICSR